MLRPFCPLPTARGFFILQRTRKSITLLMLALVLLFTGCTATSTEQTATATRGQTIVAEAGGETATATDGKIVAHSTTAKGGTAAKTTAKAGNGAGTTDQSGKSGTTATEKNSSKQTKSGKTAATAASASTAKRQGGSADQIGTTHRQTTKKHTTTQSKTVTCTVTVECKNIQNHMDQLKGGHERYVPEDGYIIRAESRTVDRGSTAYDVLKLACGAHGIRLTAKSTSYGVYVVGINNLDEKDCGSASGWMYKVNGTAPMTSCGKYKMDSGDNLVFYYVCTSADR